MIPGKIYRPEDLLAIVWRRKWLIVLPFVLISSGTVVVAHYLPNLYQSETLIQIVPQRVPESYVRSTVTSRIEDRLQSLRQQILNRTRLERLIEEFKLYPEERKTLVMEDIVEGMRGDIEIQIVKGDAFKVTYTSADPRTAMKVTERLASMIIEENLKDREALADGASQFFEAQLEDARRRLEEHEKKLEAYRRRFSGELPSQLESNIQIIQNAQMQRQTLEESINRDRDRRLLLERLIGDLEAAGAPPAAASAPGAEGAAAASLTAAERLQNARANLKLLQTRLKPEHPDMIAARRLIAELERKARDEAASLGSTEAAPIAPAEIGRRNRLRDAKLELENLDRQIAHKQSEQDRLRKVIAAYQARVEAAPTRESELIALMRDYDTLRNIYTNLLSKKEDSKVAANLERRQIGEQFKVLDPARLPEKPYSPNRTRINLMGALAGLILGVGLAVLVEYRDSTVRTEDDVFTSLSLPVLAVVPVVFSSAEVRAARLRKVAVALAAAAVTGGAAALAWKFAPPW